MARALACLIAFATIGSAWQPPGGADCAIDGTVVNAITGESIPRARVVLNVANAPISVITDNAGHWRMPALPCGPVQITAIRPGFQNGGPNKPVSLASGAPAHDVEVRLSPTSVITGKVLDDQGDPVANTQLVLLASRITDGHRAFVQTGAQTGNSVSNDLGEFRLAGLTAGRYIVCAQANARVGPGEPALGESCYPASYENAAASALDLPAGGEIRANITVHEATPVHVRGVLTGMPKTQGVALTLNRRSVSSPASSRAAKISPDGKFDIAGVGPGSYLLTTDYFEAGARLHARVPVQVGNADVNDVTVHLDSGFVIPGKVRIESKSGAAPPQKGVIVAMRSSEPMSGGGPTQWNPDHSAFTIAELTPGNYRLSVVVGGKFFLKSATLGGRDILGQEVSLTQTPGPLEIVLSDDGGALDVQSTPSAGVMVLPPGGPPRTATAGPDGHASFQGLAPGDYQVYAWDDLRDVEYANPDWMRRYAAATPVSLQAGQSQQVTVKQQPSPPH